MPPLEKFRTLSAPATAELRDRGSRFLAFAYPASDLETVKAIVKTLKAEHPKANHHCVAYRMGADGSIYRAGDDGEPAGSAGRPILAAIDSAGLQQVLIVVVRYFGGTLLGVPGLIHAYGTVAADALKAAEITERWVEKRLRIECDYGGVGEVLYLLRKSESTIYSQDMQLFCVIEAGVPLPQVDGLRRQLGDMRGVSIKET
jgi:uncharacterized YigZ family protein